jgi:hypothetical protein
VTLNMADASHGVTYFHMVPHYIQPASQQSVTYSQHPSQRGTPLRESVRETNL